MADGDVAAAAVQNGATDLAVSVMWALSGRQYGVCPVVARPCRAGLDIGSELGVIGQYSLTRIDGGWLNSPCGCGSVCRLGGPRAVHLPGPVNAVSTVKIDGEELPETAYRVEGNVLYRVGGVWPPQNLGAPAGEVGTWTVEYERGQAVPPGVDRLTGLLAQEFIAACTGGKCRLPRNVTSVTRQGVSYQVYNPQEIYTTGKTGLAEIDMWLAAINPHALMQAPVVM